MQGSAFKDRQSGTSLVELLVGIGILAIIGTFAANFFTRLNSSDLEASSRASAINQLTAVGNSIDRDLKLRLVPPSPATLDPLCSGGTCSAFTYKRLVKPNTAGTKEVENPVRVLTRCVAMPTRVRAQMNDKKLSLNAQAVIAATDESAGVAVGKGRCLKKVNCPINQYPRIEFIVNPVANASNPIYPPILPELQDSAGVTKNVVGAAVCAESDANSDKVIVEAFILTADERLRVEMREMIFPRKNIANIQMLPNCDKAAVNCFGN